MSINPEQRLADVRLPGIGGWNSYIDPSAIQDNQLSDVQNMNYEKGFLSVREGSTKLYDKPSGESADPLQVLTAKTSDGVEYVIAIYGSSFYVRHETNSEWVKINQSYTPTETTLRYGYTVWQNGRGDDRLYICNGVDDMIRWDLCVNTVATAASAGATTVTLTDGTRFPSSGGTLILKSTGGAIFTEAYSSRTGNVFTLSGTLNSDIAAGSIAVADMIQKGSMEIGKHISKHQRRLIVANYYGGETVLFGSVQGDPEDFSLASTIAGAFTQVISDGNGEITGLHDFGQYLVIEKESSFHSLRFRIAEDLGSKLTEVEPLISGESIGPIDSVAVARIHDTLLFPTRSNGFLSHSPISTGDSAEIGKRFLSKDISTYVRTNINVTNAQVGVTDNKVYWAVALKGADINTITLEYDTLRDTWSKHVGWAVQSFTEKNGEVLYLDKGDGSVRQINSGDYNDNNEEYLASALGKRYDFDVIGQPKSMDVLYIQGFMTIASEFYVDVHLNEDGALSTQTYRINKDTDNLYISQPITDEMGAFVLGEPVLGMNSLKGIANLIFFRCYLGVKKKNAFYNVQPRFYGTRAAFWGITGMSMNPTITPIIPSQFLVSPIIDEQNA